MKIQSFASVLSLVIAQLFLYSFSAFAGNQMINLDVVQMGGATKWMPATIMVKKGDAVTLIAKSKVPGAQCLEIDAFKVMDSFDDKGKMIKFVADKVGNFPIKCHSNPGLAVGQLIVTP